MKTPSRKRLIALALLSACVGTAAWALPHWWHPAGPGPGFAHGNGRIEATEIDVATKAAGRLLSVSVDEGELVQAGQVVAQMQVDTLDAMRAEAVARTEQARNAVASAQAAVAARQSDKAALEAAVRVREAELEAWQRRLARSQTLSAEGASPQQEYDDDRARVQGGQATLAAAQAQVVAAQAGIAAAQAQVVGAQSALAAAQAGVQRVDTEVRDTELRAPRKARVQYRIAQAGEVLGNGGKVLNLLDLEDVSMSFFLPETVVGRLALGAEARIILDAAPQYVIPATISFVASSAQFTPKTVETEAERQKLMFRVKAKIPRELLAQHLQQVKTGLPGVAWVRTDPQAAWPAELQVKVPQ